MPAISADTVALPRIPTVDPTAADRSVVSVTTAPSGFEGEGFPVRRAFAGVDLRALDPFVHMDQMGEVDYAPGEPKGTPWHPHRGFETVTYMIDGVFQHQDSNGGGGFITDGDTQWMTAGSRIVNLLAADLHEWSVGEAVMPASPRQSQRVAYAGREAWLIRGLDAATARQREAVDPASYSPSARL
jgi:hypothetical protein